MKIRSFQSLCCFFGVAIFSFTGFFSCKTRSFAGGSVKVIDGRETDDGEYPFVLKIGAENKEFICTASLIAPNLVLTAAHCIDDFVFKEAGRIYADTSVKMVLSNSFRVPASSTSPLDRHSGAASYSVQVLEIESVSLHPLYEKSLMLGGQGVHRFQPDLALFKLKTPFVGAEPVTVGWSEALNVGDDVEFAGYGCSLEPDKTDPLPYSAKRLGKNKVRGIAGHIFRLGEGNTTSDRQQSTCAGDSGGPAFVRDATGKPILVGVTSTGYMYSSDFAAIGAGSSGGIFLKKAADDPAAVFELAQTACESPLRRKGFVTTDGSSRVRICAEGDNYVGPISKEMRDACKSRSDSHCDDKNWTIAQTQQDWGNQPCPLGTSLNANLGFCVGAQMAFGPFQPRLQASCARLGHAADICNADIWPEDVLKNVLQDTGPF